ncbi:uncharacterized protein At1g01500 [Cryptomeria japonica]|uniref:uncharacterized protein At1g01500 n=1 Tax=Cryptomeria japonica TaxID=3369 RepID=UPI0025ACE9B7|nr:uncharacterized protein At1g01500 [Cryptomeria japonica]
MDWYEELGQKKMGAAQGWLEVRLFYVRVRWAEGAMPQVLLLRHAHRGAGAMLEINGARVSPSEGFACLSLRRDRLDKDSAEATYVSTDNVRTAGTLHFEVYNGDFLLLCGTLHKGAKDGVWSMDCCSAVRPGASKQQQHPDKFDFAGHTPPTLEVYVAGCCSGSPLILTKTLQLVPRRRRGGTLDAIPEDEETQVKSIVLSDNSHQMVESREYEDLDEKIEPNLGNFYPGGYIEGEEGELSWFNAGVRVGVGIGLGMCLGIGIGVGLLMRTYQATTRTFRRRLF